MIRRFFHVSLTSLAKITHKSHQMLCKFSTLTRQHNKMLRCVKILEFPLAEIHLAPEIIKWLLGVTSLFAWIADDYLMWLYGWPTILASEAFSIVYSAKFQYLTVWSELTRTLFTNRSHLYYMIWKYTNSKLLFYLDL